MILKRLTILNYRNIADAQLEFSPKINCLIGQNGEGKTNVLDAIFFLSFTKSTASSVDSANVKHGEEKYYNPDGTLIKTTVYEYGEPVSVEMEGE